MDTREERRYNPYYDYHQRGDSDQQPRSKFTTSGYPYGEGPPTRSPSVSSALLPGPSHETRNRPRYEQPRPTPILNVRLVGYSETRTRGRARERGPASEDPASSGNNEDGSENRAPTVEVRSETDELTPIQQSVRDYFLRVGTRKVTKQLRFLGFNKDPRIQASRHDTHYCQLERLTLFQNAVSSSLTT